MVICEERGHGRCAAVRWLWGLGFGGINDHAMLYLFYLSIFSIFFCLSKSHLPTRIEIILKGQ